MSHVCAPAESQPASGLGPDLSSQLPNFVTLDKSPDLPGPLFPPPGMRVTVVPVMKRTL